MKNQSLADATMTAAIFFLGATLVFTGSILLRQGTGGPAAPTPPDLATLLGAAAAGVGVAVTLWWLAALACAFISGFARLHGRPRLASAAGAWSPAFMRRLAAVVLGLNLMAAPVSTAAETGAGPLDPRWQADIVAAAPLGAEQAPQTARFAGPSAPAGPPVSPAWTPQGPPADPGPLARPVTRHPASQGPSAPADSDVVVQSGDSLWSIAASALGPFATDVEVAVAWPEWYRANRSVIGSDPNVILPGQVLQAPAG